jgi:hypothetical protein
VVIYFALRELVTVVFSLSAGWYLVGLGLAAIAVMLFEPAGLWPLLRPRLGGDWLSVQRQPPPTAMTSETVGEPPAMVPYDRTGVRSP